MILSTVALLAVQVAPTLATVEALSPLAAGELVLAGKDHGPIVKIVVPGPGGMNAPGAVERQMVEQLVASAGGCSRRRWTVQFFHGPGVTEDQASLSAAWSATEVALPGPAGCPDDGYVHLNPGFEPVRAFTALRRLDDLRRGEAGIQFTCSDETPSNLCADPAKIPLALAKLSPRVLTDEDGETVFWLYDSGAAVTDVRYSATRPDQVSVSRRIPAPF